MGAFPWLIQKRLQHILDDYESYGVESERELPLVKNRVEQLADDWICFGRLTIPWRLTDADEVLADLGRRSIIQKIEDVGGDICRELGKHVPTAKLLLRLLDGCQRKTDKILKAEIVESWEFLLNSGFRVHPPDLYSWTIFLCSFRESLRLACTDADRNFFQEQVSALVSHLDIMQIYLGGLQKLCYSIFIGSPEIRYLIRHVVCVVVRIAIQSCICRFNRTDPERAKIEFTRLLDLYYDISPVNLEFILLNLRVREAISIITARMGSSIITAHSARVGSDFLGVDFYYPLHWIGDADLRRGLTSLLTHFSNRNDSDGEIGEADLRRELMYLLTLLSKSTLRNDSDGEGVRSFSTEIKALLEEAAASFSTMARDRDFYLSVGFTSFSGLLAKIYLLEGELFIREQLNTNTSSMLFSHSLFFEVNVILKNLRGFAKYLDQQGQTDYVKQILVLTEELANELESLCALFHSKKLTATVVKHSLLQLLFKIVFSKAEAFLTELLKCGNTALANWKDQIESLAEELEDCKLIVTYKLVRSSSDEVMIFRNVEAVAKRITIFSYSLLPDSDMFQKIILSLPELLDEMKNIKAKRTKISPQFPVTDFPKTNVLGFIGFLGKSIQKLMKYDCESIELVKYLIEEVQLHLGSLKSLLIKISNLDVEQDGLNDLGNRIMDTAYELEYLIDSIEVDGHLQHSHHSLWLHCLQQDISLINEQVSRIYEMHAGKVQNLPHISSEMVSRDTTPTNNGTAVHLVDEEELIIEQLTRGSLQRDVVSIVGMPGIGKTTLAKQVYNNKKVMYYFHRQAWCTVSQVYSKREMLLEILKDIHGITNEFYRMTDDDLQLKLRQRLLKKRYLIVMDDLWDTISWNDLKNSFPDDNNGSRILITSRLRDVAMKIKPDRNPHSIRLLSDVESWILLEQNIFKGGVCPEELLLIGKEIAQHCEGLPLAVVTIAGLLRRTEKRQDWWERISKSLSSQIMNDPENGCMKILELSYKHLPEYLKPCFLYLGVFLEDKDIPVSKLVRFWLAEGFMHETESKSLEDVAEDCLMDLINRSLVMISKTRSDGKVKTCCLHDLLRDLCRSKAKEENFLHFITRCDEPYSSYTDSDYGMEFDFFEHQLAPVTFKSYRLSMYLKRNHFIDSRPSGPGTRSLIFFAPIDSEPRCPYDVSFIFQNFKLLRVLDLECMNLGVIIPVEIGLMVQLRYLAICGFVDSVPSSIANLWKLETLVVKGLRGKVILPETIWSMASLRHLHVNNLVAFDLQGLDEQAGSYFHLYNLVSFSTPSLSCGEDMMNIFRRLPNLRKMRCIFFESRDSSKDCNRFPMLECLTHLQSLKIIYYGRALNSGEFVLPLNLNKLTLSNFRLPWHRISSIGGLPNLIVLKLLSAAFEGERWDMREDEFKKLKFLKLDSLNIVEWNASCDHLPNLERLVLQNCEDLKEIPIDFADICTLQMIEVQWCGQSVEESAKEIGNMTEAIKIDITSN